MQYEGILNSAAALLNDTSRTYYNNETLIPYLNMALTELKELFALHNIAVTNKTSQVITVPANTTKIGFDTTPALPSDLMEIQALWESQTGQDFFVPIVKKEFLTGLLNFPTPRVVFGVWAWINQEITLPSVTSPADIKIDYIRDLFAPVAEADMDQENTVINSDSFLYNRTAALATEYGGENTEKASRLNEIAAMAMDRSLGISIKGAQAITTRRRPFRASYRRGGVVQ